MKLKQAIPLIGKEVNMRLHGQVQHIFVRGIKSIRFLGVHMGYRMEYSIMADRWIYFGHMVKEPSYIRHEVDIRKISLAVNVR